MARSANVLYEEELKKNSELNESDMQSLKSWYTKQLHLPKLSDRQLAFFLHSNYYHVEPTKATIETFYTFRTHTPEFFANRDPLNKELQQAFNILSIIKLPQPTREGYTVILMTLIDDDASKYIFNDHVKFTSMQIDLWLYRQGMTNGHIILIDTAKLTFRHVFRVSPLNLTKFCHYLQDGLPVRLKGIHFMNTRLPTNVLFNMIKPFLKKELVAMFHLHSTASTLDSFIPLEILPNELGGKAGPLMELHLAQVKKLEEHRDWFFEDEQCSRVDEIKRPRKSRTTTYNQPTA